MVKDVFNPPVPALKAGHSVPAIYLGVFGVMMVGSVYG